ncbi:homoserine kinase [soil metagenome]
MWHRRNNARCKTVHLRNHSVDDPCETIVVLRVSAHPSSATAFAPATVGNVAAGFDVLGHALVAIGDTVTARKISDPGVRMSPHSDGSVPADPSANTAGAGLIRLLEELEMPFGLEILIRKGIPLGSGMGGSAASAAAAIVAVSRLLEVPLSTSQLLEYGMHGEAVATGSYHADNLAPAILGGLVLVRSSAPLDVVRIPVPAGLHCVLVHPALRVDTWEARAVLPASIPLEEHVTQSGNLGALIAGCHSADLDLISRALQDVVAEPRRKHLVKGFEAVRSAALDHGALGCSLSGSGPSMFAWCDGDERAESIRGAMMEAFAAAGVRSRGWVSPVDSPGARVVQ